MATNSDGSIVLSVQIDEESFKPQLNKLKTQIEQLSKKSDLLAKSAARINAELAKSQIYNEKVKQAQEKTAQAVEKTYQAIEKTNQAKLKTSQMDDKTILSAEKVTQAELKTAQAQEKLNQEKAKTSVQNAKLSQEEERVRQQELNTSSAREKLNQQIERTNQLAEKTTQEEEKTRQSIEKTAQEQHKTFQAEQQNTQQVEKTKQAIERTAQAQEKTKQAAINTEKAQRSLSTAAKGTLNSFQKLATSLGILLTLRSFLNFSNEASKLASQTEANLKRLSTLYGEAGQQVYDFAEKSAAALGMSKTAAYEAAADYGNIFTTFASGAESAKLTTEMLQATAVIASQTGRTYQDVFEKIQSGLYGNTRAIDDLGISVRQASLMQTQAYQTITGGVKKWNDLTDAELQQARALGILEQTHMKYGNTVLQSTALTRSQFNAAFQDFKATWGQVVNAILIPVLSLVTRILNAMTSVMKLAFGLVGKEINFNNSAINDMSGGYKNMGGTIDDTTKKQKKLTGAVKDTVKESKKLLANFDELQILSQDNGDGNGGSGASGGGTGGAGGAGGGLNTIDYSSEGGLEDSENIPNKLMLLAGALVGLALVGLGLILLFNAGITGKIIGLGMIVAGAVGFWGIAQEYGQMLGEEEKKKLEDIALALGLAFVTIGVLLLFTGQWKFGIAAIAYGIVFFTSAMALEEFSQDIKSKVAKILVIAGLVAVIIGTLLLFTKKGWKFGLGLIVEGIVAIGTAYLLDGSELETELKTFILDYWKIIYAIELLMVVVGIVLLFCKQWAFGFTLIYYGIVAAVGTTKLGGDELQAALKEFVLTYWEKIYAISILMVVVGIVLLFCQQWLFGFTLLIGGIAAAVTATKLGGDELKAELKTFSDTYWKELAEIAALMIIVGIILCFAQLFLFGITLIVGAAAILITETILSWEQIKEELTPKIDAVKDWIKEYDVLLTILGLILIFVPGCILIGFGLLAAGGASLASEKDLSFTDLKNRLIDQIQSVYDGIAPYVDKVKNKLKEMVGIPGTVKVGASLSKTQSFSPAPQSGAMRIPALARGAVLPANQPFLALLGDQRRGTNIEAPLDTIKQAVSEVLASEGYNNNSSQTVILELDGREVGRTFGNILKQEQNRVGNNFVKTSLTF